MDGWMDYLCEEEHCCPVPINLSRKTDSRLVHFLQVCYHCVHRGVEAIKAWMQPGVIWQIELKKDIRYKCQQMPRYVHALSYGT